MTEFTKICEMCKGVRTFKNRKSLYYSGKTNLCQSCSQRTRNTVEMYDLTNRVFERLTVIKRGENDNKNRTTWVCKCTCGNIVTYGRTLLIKGDVVSCGCYHKEIMFKGSGNLSGTYWYRIVSGAKNRSLEISITKEYAWQLFEQQGSKCALSGVDLIMIKQYSVEPTKQTASLDRIDSSKGYIEGNVQWVHKDVNDMKQSIKQDVFISWCKKIANNS